MRFRPRLDLLESKTARPVSGVFWTFEADASALLFVWYWGVATVLVLLLRWATGTSWVFTFTVVGVLATGLFWTFQPIWQALTLALRLRLALLQIKPVRKLAKCETLLVAYHRSANGSVTFEGVMGIEDLLELSPEKRHAAVRHAMRGLRSSARLQSERGTWLSAAPRPVFEGNKVRA